MEIYIGGGFLNIWYLNPFLGEMIQFDSYFSNGLVQPPTRNPIRIAALNDPTAPKSRHATKSQPESAGLEGAIRRAEGWGKLVTWPQEMSKLSMDSMEGKPPRKKLVWWAKITKSAKQVEGASIFQGIKSLGSGWQLSICCVC